MAEIKLTKNEMREQQKKMAQLVKYLPTLQLKKSMLQAVVYEARMEIAAFKSAFEKIFEKVEEFSPLLSSRLTIDIKDAARIKEVNKRYENIAGVEVPYFDSVLFEDFSYTLFDSPPWIDGVVLGLRSVAEAKAKIFVAEEKKRALEEELRMVSIRVNLFEKILIPRAKKNIKKIKIFLGDQELAAVSRAKMAKNKIEQLKEQEQIDRTNS